MSKPQLTNREHVRRCTSTVAGSSNPYAHPDQYGLDAFLQDALWLLAIAVRAAGRIPDCQSSTLRSREPNASVSWLRESDPIALAPPEADTQGQVDLRRLSPSAVVKLVGRRLVRI
jgi:hypothetical protein